MKEGVKVICFWENIIKFSFLIHRVSSGARGKVRCARNRSETSSSRSSMPSSHRSPFTEEEVHYEHVHFNAVFLKHRRPISPHSSTNSVHFTLYSYSL